MRSSSYKTILRASSIIGGASVINIAAGLVKMKVVAVMLGPAGVGLLGLYQNLVQTAGLVSGLGVARSGTRQIAAAGPAAVDRVRRALFWGALVQALLGAIGFWLASSWIAARLIADPARTSEVAWLSLGVGLTVAGGAQGALLNGLRRVGDIARVQAGSGVLSAALGVILLWIWEANGLIALVLVGPMVSFTLGHVYVSRLDRPAGPPESALVLAREWAATTRLGLAFMVSSLVTMLGFLAARVLVQRELGADGLGQFQAAWAIGMTYLGFVLGAMGTDYYPRLTASIVNPVEATRLVNEQTEVALLLCGPVLVALLGCAPWVFWLLYTPEFGPAVDILRWQILGDILKVMSWPLGFVMLAAGTGKTFILAETLGIAVFVIGVFVGLPLIGVTATGLAFLALYIVYLPLVRWIGGQLIGFRWSRSVRAQAAMLIGSAVAVELAARLSNAAGAATGLGLGMLLAMWSLLQLSAVSEARGRLAPVTRTGERMRAWLSSWI